MLVLALVALAGLRPWEPDAVAPHLGVSSGPKVELGEAVVVADAPGVARAVGIAAAVPAAAPAPATRDGGSAPAVSQNQAVLTAAAPPAPVEPAPELPDASDPAPAPAPTAPPSTTVADDGSGSGGPSTAVVELDPEPSCEGDEYVVVIKFPTMAASTEEAEVSILIRRVAQDGSATEIQLEGKLGDVRELLEQIGSDGDCVEVRLDAVEEEDPAGVPADSGADDEELSSSPMSAE